MKKDLAFYRGLGCSLPFAAHTGAFNSRSSENPSIQVVEPCSGRWVGGSKIDERFSALRCAIQSQRMRSEEGPETLLRICHSLVLLCCSHLLFASLLVRWLVYPPLWFSICPPRARYPYHVLSLGKRGPSESTWYGIG